MYTYIHSVDWENTSFDKTKAYVCAKISELIYEYKPTDISDRTNFYDINDITLENYENINQFNSALNDFDMRLLFIAETQDSITIGISAWHVVFVASRGTTNWKDWSINLNFGKTRACDIYNLDFHSGFYGIAITTLSKIHERLERENVPIYFTGHSLGGALTGILFFYFNSDCNCKSNFKVLKKNSICAYTFGMPKFSNADHKTFENLYHIYNTIDIVHAIPPKIFGYSQSGKQYEISNVGLTFRIKKKYISLIKFISIIMNGKSVKEHIMMTYLSMLQKLLP